MPDIVGEIAPRSTLILGRLRHGLFQTGIRHANAAAIEIAGVARCIPADVSDHVHQLGLDALHAGDTGLEVGGIHAVPEGIDRELIEQGPEPHVRD